MAELQEIRESISRKNLSGADLYENRIESIFKYRFEFANRPIKEHSDITLLDYVKLKPITKNDTRKYVYVQRLGKFSNLEDAVIKRILEYIETFFEIEVKLLDDLDEALLIKDVFITQRNKIYIASEYVLYNLISDFVPRSAVASIAITNYQLHSEDHQVDIMGCALTKFRSALWSLAPFEIESNKADEVGLKEEIESLLKLTIHEMGHIFSLPHCEKYECMMGIVDYYYLDEYPVSYCPNCLSKLFWNLNVDEANWLEKQRAYWQKYDYPENVKLYTDLINSLTKQ